MKRSDFRDLLSRRVLLFDGGYGTSFFARGFADGPAERLNLEHPEVVETLQREYVDAGADILLTNTFGGNRAKLAECGLEARIAEVNAGGVAIARRAAVSTGDRNVLVFGDISSTGRFPVPSGEGSFDACARIFAEQAALLAEAGCDGLIVETMTDIKELKSAVVGIRECLPNIPLVAQMAFDVTGATLTGATVEVFAALLGDLDVDVLGMNCLIGPEPMLPVFRRLAAASGCLLSVEPNAGDPRFDGTRTHYEMDPLAFSLFAESFVDAGASIVGGCCGTTPEHIRAMRALIRDARPRARIVRRSQILTSRTMCFDVSTSDFMRVGERINPAGRPALKERILARDWSALVEEAASQVQEGADVLDVNFGVEKLLDERAIAEGILELDRAGCAPLSLDIQTLPFLERALREYPGRPLVNSSAADRASLAPKLALLKKYGGMMILLAMGESIPVTAVERMELVRSAVAIAEREYGVSRDRLIVDPLVMAVGAGNDPRVALDVIAACREEGLRTCVGLSNVSYGMPDRGGINAAYLAQCVERGLGAAILNPGDALVTESLRGALILRTGKLEGAAATRAKEHENPLVAALLAGKSVGARKILQSALDAGTPPLEASQCLLGAAMEEIGALYEAKAIFLPHLLFAAQTAFGLFDWLNDLCPAQSASKGLVLVATVQGDIHDIGKNIIATVLRAGGYEIVDLGKDVGADAIVERARALAPGVVALSAMMTTTVGRVGELASRFKEEGIACPIIAGGASMSEELARLWGVHYGGNGSEGLALCRRLIG